MINCTASLLINALIFPLAATSIFAVPVIARFSVSVTVTSRQAILSYTAPSTSPCTVELSESNTYSPVVHDVNGTLFSGANSDDRTGNLGAGTTSRVFVAGTVPLDGRIYPARAADGNDYSRALQRNKLHYYRVTCGADTGTGTFTTRDTAPGDTSPKPLPIGLNGESPYPTFTNSSTQEIIDPVSGALMKRITMPRQFKGDEVIDSTFGAASGTNWTTPSNVLADDAAVATYAAGTQDWLFIDAGTPNIQYFLYAVKFKVKGNATGGENAKLEMCITTDGGLTCRSDVQEMTLSVTSNTTTCYPQSDCSDPTTINTWSTPYSKVLATDLTGNSAWGIRVRKKATGAGTVNIQYAEYSLLVDVTPYSFENGAEKSCNISTLNDSTGNPGRVCMTRMFASAGALYWIKESTGEARFLGLMKISGAGFTNSQVVDATAVWSDTDPRKYYAVGLNDSAQSVLVELTLPASGSTTYDASAASNTTVRWTKTNLTVSPTLNPLINTKDARFETANYGCQASSVQQGRVVMYCRRGHQDSMGFVVTYKLSDNTIDVALDSWSDPATRWCGIHTDEPPLPSSRQTVWVFSELRGPGTGQGDFQVRMNEDVDISETTIDVTSTHSTPGEPVAATTPTQLPAPMVKAVGDVMVIESEYWRITGINSATQIVVERGYGPSNPATHATNTLARMACKAVNYAVDASQSGNVFFDVLDTVTPNYVVDWHSYGSHHDYGFPYRTGASVAETVPADTNPSGGTPYTTTYSPAWAGTTVNVEGNTVQKHPSANHQFDGGSGPLNQWGLDITPQAGYSAMIPSSTTYITGSLWKIVPGATLHRKTFPTHIGLGIKTAEDISSTATGNVIGGSDSYKYCVANAVNECRTGSAIGDLYVNIPSLTPVAVTNATNTTPIVITTASKLPYTFTGFAYPLLVSGVGGNTAANGSWTAERLTATTWQLYSSVGNGAYTSGGTAVKRPTCAASELSGLQDLRQEDEACIADRPPFGMAFLQRRMDREDTNGRNTRYHGQLLTLPHRLPTTSSAQALPNGGWVIVPVANNFSKGRDGEAFLVKMTAFPDDDAVNRTTFIQRTLAIGAVGGADNAIVKVGYTPDFYFTSRDEVSVVAASNTDTDPFWNNSESFTGISCAAGCSATLRVIPDRVLYYQIVWRNGTTPVQTSNVAVLTDQAGPSTPSSPPPGAPALSFGNLASASMQLKSPGSAKLPFSRTSRFIPLI